MSTGSTRGCCGPAPVGDRRAEALRGGARHVDGRGAAPAADGMVRLPGGECLMGSDADEGEPGDGESPVRTVRLAPFLIDATAVSNRAFGRFIEATVSTLP